MSAANFVFYNGSITKTTKLLLSPDNRSFRYGDGFFETMKLVNGKVVLENYHLDRLFESMERMRFLRPDYFTPDYIRENIATLAKKNYHDKLARIRLTVFRGDGGLYEVNNHFPHHLIQSWALGNGATHLNENGLEVGVYKEARKVCDSFSDIKSNNFLPYVMGALWARERKLDDVLILNPYGRVAEATIANIFIISNGIIKTPPLSEGPVNGVMRRHLLKCFREKNIPCEVTPLELEEVLQASEVFLTNSVHGLRWVKRIEKSEYTHAISCRLHGEFVKGVFR